MSPRQSREQQPQPGYLLKQAQSLLRLRMEQALAPLDLTVSHYSCLHRLHVEPGISGAALARATFVTRQSMQVLLQQLLERGLVARSAAPSGRALPTALTAAGKAVLRDAERVVDAVERQMLSGLDPAGRRALAHGLEVCIEGLTR